MISNTLDKLTENPTKKLFTLNKLLKNMLSRIKQIKFASLYNYQLKSRLLLLAVFVAYETYGGPTLLLLDGQLELELAAARGRVQGGLGAAELDERLDGGGGRGGLERGGRVERRLVALGLLG